MQYLAQGFEMVVFATLQSLYIGGNALTDEALEVLGSSFRLLTFLKFVCTEEVDYDISHLSRIPILHSLWLQNCDSLSADSNNFASLTALKELQLTECNTSLRAMTNIS